MRELLVDFAVQVVAAVLVNEVPLVERDDERLAGLEHHVEDALVLLRDFLRGVDEHDADLGGVDDAAGAQGRVVLVALGVLDLLAQACRVNELPQLLVELNERVNRVDGGARRVIDDGALLAGELVEQ